MKSWLEKNGIEMYSIHKKKKKYMKSISKTVYIDVKLC